MDLKLVCQPLLHNNNIITFSTLKLLNKTKFSECKWNNINWPVLLFLWSAGRAFAIVGFIVWHTGPTQQQAKLSCWTWNITFYTGHSNVTSGCFIQSWFCFNFFGTSKFEGWLHEINQIFYFFLTFIILSLFVAMSHYWRKQLCPKNGPTTETIHPSGLLQGHLLAFWCCVQTVIWNVESLQAPHSLFGTIATSHMAGASKLRFSNKRPLAWEDAAPGICWSPGMGFSNVSHVLCQWSSLWGIQ